MTDRRTTTHPPLAAHAVVVGAGLAGLTAAQALSRHVERVTIVERDDLPERPSARPGVPQGRHLHVLQPGGSAALERLLPGFEAELLAAGATPVRIPEDALWMSPQGWSPRFPARDGHVVLSASRELIEWAVRRRVFESPQILVRSGLDVRGLVIRDGRAQGIDVRSRRADRTSPTVTIDANVVVDASGRGSPFARWLVAAGLEAPAETVIDSDLVYASRLYRRSPGDTPGWKGALVQPRPPHEPRAGILFPVEGNRWLLTMSAAGGDEPPGDEEGFLAFARSLRIPDIAEVVERAEPLGPIATYRRTENRWRHYERLQRPLDGFLAVGDALRTFNPLYGQGMSTAVMTAEALDRCLTAHLAGRRDLAGFTAGAQKELVRPSAGAWTISTGVDLRYPNVKGDTRGRLRRAVDGLVGRYMDRIVRAATHDREVNAALFDAIGLLAEPWSLMRPSIAWRALRPGPPAASARPVWPAPVPSAAEVA
ncbi:MAG TPA: FAD-binding protein [Acidimicrobiales bacterium]|jgi:2-polyprenyl-6-methoxyphenol hydroxylase-like FAD-dependent oxidoreductase